MRAHASHGTGRFSPSDLGSIGENVVFEEGVLVFHPENLHLESNIYVGHQTILKGYHQSKMEIGSDCWIGQQCFFHSAGGLRIGRAVGIGPGVRILTSTHEDPGRNHPILSGSLQFAPVSIGDGSDLGMSATILPGVRLGRGVQVGAGAVVTSDLPDFCIAAGVPARIIGERPA